MQSEEQSIQEREQAVNSIVLDIDRYTEKCESCGAPARTELSQATSDHLHGVDYFQYCTNPTCWQFDSSLVAKRHRLEEHFKEGRGYRRHFERMLKLEISKLPVGRRRRARSYAVTL